MTSLFVRCMEYPGCRMPEVHRYRPGDWEGTSERYAITFRLDVLILSPDDTRTFTVLLGLLVQSQKSLPSRSIARSRAYSGIRALRSVGARTLDSCRHWRSRKPPSHSLGRQPSCAWPQQLLHRKFENLFRCPNVPYHCQEWR